MKAKNEDYIKIFNIYIYRKLFYFLLAMVIFLPILLFGSKSIKILEYYIQKNNAYTFRYDDFRLSKYEGDVEILDENNQVVYRGEFRKGHCNGKGVLYHGGRKYYEGNFVNDKMQDDSAKLFYENGKLSYKGSFIENRVEGDGIKYYESGQKKEEGTFLNSTLEGDGISYDKQGLIIYKGNYKKGKYHGEGILFNKDESIHYEGAFLNGEKHGEGKLYSEYGKLLYTGSMIHNRIDFAAYVNTTLDVIQTHFVETPYLFIANKKCAFIYHSLDLIFVSDAKIGFTENMLKDLEGDDFTKIMEMDEKTKKENILCNEILFVNKAYDLWDENDMDQKNIQKKLRNTKGNPFQNERKQNEEDAFVKLFLEIKYTIPFTDASYKKYSNWIYQIKSFKEKMLLEEMYKTYEQNKIYIFDEQRLLYSKIEYAHQKAK